MLRKASENPKKRQGWERKTPCEWNARDFAEWFAECFRIAHGVPFRLNYPKDVALMKRFLQTNEEGSRFTNEQLREYIKWFTDNYDNIAGFKGVPTIGHLLSSSWFAQIVKGYDREMEGQWSYKREEHPQRPEAKRLADVFYEFLSDFQDIIYRITETDIDQIVDKLIQIDFRGYMNPLDTMHAILFYAARDWKKFKDENGRCLSEISKPSITRILNDRWFDYFLEYALQKDAEEKEEAAEEAEKNEGC